MVLGQILTRELRGEGMKEGKVVCAEVTGSVAGETYELGIGGRQGTGSLGQHAPKRSPS